MSVVTDLPIEAVLPDLLGALAAGRAAVLQAPPGAGKTTRVPLALLDAAWLGGGKVVMLEPRRLAARAAARRMAEMLGEAVGGTVGYRIRLDAKVGPTTRIEVVTEGILTRMLQDDPALSGIGAVIFDEFHERSLHADLGLALALEAQGSLRPDLRILVMSATLDAAPVAALLGGAPVIASEGRAFPVETRWLEREPAGRIEEVTARAVRAALSESDGDLLVFLPGAGEIRRTLALLEESPDCRGMVLAPLYGDLPQAEQDRAIRPDPQGRRRVVLATAIAETSLTIEGVRGVVDSGWMRVPCFEPRSGMTRLETVRVSRAAADQRRGRAGRLGPGLCWRLWTRPADAALVPFTAPEIFAADLAPLALELAQWGVADPAALDWLDPPPAAAFAQGRELLRRLGALDGDGRITRHGRVMPPLGLHPRLAHMVLAGKALGLGGLACDIAALLEERDVIKGERDSDLRTRLETLRGEAGNADRAALARVRQAARELKRRLGIKDPDGGIAGAGLLLAFAYPDRIARRRPGPERRYLLANGRGAFLAAPEPLAAEDWLAVAQLDGDRREARIFLAAPLAASEIEEHFAGQIETGESVAWDGREQAVQARRQRRLGALVLKDEPLPAASSEAVTAALVEGIRAMGLACLPWSEAACRLRARIAFLRRVEGDAWPDLSDAALLAGIADWLAPHLSGMARRAHLDRLDLAAILEGLLPWERRRVLEELAPTHIQVPSGSRIPIDYSSDEPVLAVRLQEMFGLAETPRLAGGRVPVLLHLLSPARRPVQVTRDLAGFWAGAYHAVRKDLKGQYPKHYWPDDPMQAEATARAKPRRP